ncbi:secretory calcium-binding phosphoprotein 5 isoform X2 [Esox lucius]|uniref:secretory calcium-binding phosphoprotein 5 isoform X2 n=1 Tax=Esox lucius TaxID=8010 RepID=UPI0009734C4E|nr:secretory calcium-binding phosphoprotein 5 isoform X2 [Esox lucius]
MAITCKSVGHSFRELENKSKVSVDWLNSELTWFKSTIDSSLLCINHQNCIQSSRINKDLVKMKITLLCLCLATSISAAPLKSFLNYLPHYGGPRQSGPPTQVNEALYPGGQPQPGLNGPVSMEIVFPQGFPGTGGQNGQSYLSQAFIKYSLPKAPGRKSVEIYYPFDFVQQKMTNNPQMPQLPNMFPFEYQPQTMPQQIPNIPFPPYDTRLSQDPMQGAQQEQPAQTGQVPHGQP